MSDETNQQLLDRIQDLERKLKTEKSKKSGGLDIRVSKKGGVSIYGLQRFPVTLYANQWKQILEHGEEIRSFIEMNRADLNIRPEES